MTGCTRASIAGYFLCGQAWVERDNGGKTVSDRQLSGAADYIVIQQPNSAGDADARSVCCISSAHFNAECVTLSTQTLMNHI